MIPGGVNSPVRAFNGVGGTPVFIEKAQGAYIFDTEGKQYIDYVGSWGPMIWSQPPNNLEGCAQNCRKRLKFLVRRHH